MCVASRPSLISFLVFVLSSLLVYSVSRVWFSSTAQYSSSVSFSHLVSPAAAFALLAALPAAVARRVAGRPLFQVLQASVSYGLADPLMAATATQVRARLQTASELVLSLQLPPPLRFID